MKYISAIGEALIDFIPSKRDCHLKNVPSFTRVCGGAPANVCAAASLLGGKTRIITQLGKDAFGDYIVDTLRSIGVDTSCVLRTDKANTALAFVSLTADGGRDFSFYRKPSADMLLSPESITADMLKDTGILHFCSVDLIEAPVKYAHIRAIELAQKQNAVISFDPNLRLNLWDSTENCIKTVREFVKYADIIKISDDELPLITGDSDIRKAAAALFENGVKMIMYTMGAKGAAVLTPKNYVSVNSIDVNVKDTTGAGDCIIGSFLYALAAEDIKKDDLINIPKEKLKKMLTFANFCSSFSVTSGGAISSYGTMLQIRDFMANSLS